MKLTSNLEKALLAYQLIFHSYSVYAEFQCTMF